MTSVLVDEIASSVVDATDNLLRTTGFCPPPSVHILAEDTDQPYVGFISCRPYYRGADAAAAITGLGLLPSVLAATRLVVTWEDHDLRTALQVPGDTFPTAIVTLEADQNNHTLLWHAFDAQPGPLSEAGVPTVQPHWQQSVRYANPPLLEPIAALLDLWRQARRDDVEQTASGLQQAGYTIRWANPTT
ncbi:hypothetical protein ACIGB8_27690 [Promicromonospora sukumoe]|uniref:hypothetical protein n=1 Tax=Promicromonospora sukumoe TaxID=88382 RepID=UPI0037C6FED4